MVHTDANEDRRGFESKKKHEFNVICLKEENEMNKRVTIFVIVVTIVIFGLAGCGKDIKNQSTSQEQGENKNSNKNTDNAAETKEIDVAEEKVYLLTRRNEFNQRGELVAKTEYTYDEQGNETSQIEYRVTPDGDVRFEWGTGTYI